MSIKGQIVLCIFCNAAVFESQLDPFRSIYGSAHKRVEDVLKFLMVMKQAAEHLRYSTWMVKNKDAERRDLWLRHIDYVSGRIMRIVEKKDHVLSI